MSGIVGLVSTAPSVDRHILVRMSDALEHRGPHGQKVWLCRDSRAGFGHTRLSIVDSSHAGSQPMQDHGRRVALVFDGEIYNHAPLRKELERAGSPFKTRHSDAETLLYAYLHWGLPDMLYHLLGIFAFAILDEANGSVFFARDRAGMKPLYYARIADQLAFASEAKALLEHPAVEARLDKDNFFHFLTFRTLPAPRTLFLGIEKLGPAEWARFDMTTGAFTKLSYWNPLQEYREHVRFSDAYDELTALLDDSLACQLEGPSSVGLLLSGGLDSGSLLALASRRRSELATFTVGYPGHLDFDESNPANVVAEHFRTRHHELAVDQTDFGDHLCAVAYYHDEPTTAPVSVPTYLLARAARAASVDVLLTGDGGDTLFLGNSMWSRIRTLQRWNDTLPDLPGRLLRRIAANVALTGTPAFARSVDLLRRASRGQPLFWGGTMDFADRGRGKILGPAMSGIGNDTYEAVIQMYWNHFRSHRPKSDIFGWMAYLELQLRLPELMLQRLDRMGMAHGVEIRAPFLDHRIVELVLALPAACRSDSSFFGKKVLRTIMSSHMPASGMRKHKRGFHAPVSIWKTGQLGNRYLPALRRFSERTALFDTEGLNKLLVRSDDRLFLSLVSFMLWHLIFIENVLPESFPGLGRQMFRSGGRAEDVRYAL